ncbi:exodeoxyribonuclease V subunit gamma [Pseudidiomarina sp. 1APR75-33.1]|uniref:exodeoxyribonuclease V subunit gamma n=1 Tax=Pseudidiomarina terrestris TaxID=2820060 RepID=UPI0026515C17|nr:exodeoxyribonuclease V subunit gamma [Pseudidiomarina sp. 1APR75-33.1]MDN7126045.1 exodeoxyribonuclease V subunit gamma [Pseudidiomarina sp. 1APR75-33.1]
MSEQSAGLIVAHGHRLEDLTELVVRLTRIAPLAPLESECVLVQSNGIAQWLKLHLAQATGIAAMLDVTLPARFQWQAYRAVLGENLPRYSPFDKDRLTWRLLRVLPRYLGQPEFAALQNYMRDDSEQRKLYQLCERLADLFDQYQMYRADWLADWAEGGATQADAENAWQPLLWRALLADVGNERWNNRAELHRRFVTAARALTPQQRPPGLPPRIIVFGISSLPQQMIEVLHALSSCCQVILCVHNPCKHFWMDSIDGRDLFKEIKRKRQGRKPGQAELDISNLHSETHALLASWGKQGGDYIGMLDQFDATAEKGSQFESVAFDLFDEDLPAQPTQLSQLQSDILNLRSNQEAQSLWGNLPDNDDSLQFVSCHSPQREVEALHDQLLHLFATHDDLKPSDIIVMVPDVDGYAPHISAVFGRYQRGDDRSIPFTIADQGMRHRHPILVALEYVLTLNLQRATASEILDILQVEALQQRFDLSPQDVVQLQTWLQEAGVRWALHEEHRQQLGLPPAAGRNSWLFGLRRMLLGYAVGSQLDIDSAWQDDEPYPEVGGLAANAAGALQQVVQALSDAFLMTTEALTPDAWSERLLTLMGLLFKATDDSDELLLNRLRKQLEEWVSAADAAQFHDQVPLTVVVESWLSRVDEHQLNQRFLAGSVNFATLMPMRAIPFKGVFLLGMNDGEYPRQRKPFDFDLMARDSRPGDRSRREDDRYLFLEALLSARNWLYVSWCGRSIKDNTDKPPSVLVSQLRDHLQQLGAQAPVQHHFLQPFNPAYFRQPQSGQNYFTFAREWQSLHQQQPQPQPVKVQPAAESWLPEGAVNLRQLYHFYQEPARWLMNLRFQSYLPTARVETNDEELFTLDGLTRWELITAMSEPLLTAADEDADADTWLHWLNAYSERLQREGRLSGGAGGELQKQSLIQTGQLLWLAVTAECERYPCVLEQEMVQAGARLRVADTFTGLRKNAAGQRVRLKLSASRLVEKSGQPRYLKLAQTWLEHLLLNTKAATTTQLISEEKTLSLTALTPECAQQQLQQILDCAERGLQEPLPVHLELVLEGWKKSLSKGAADFISAGDFAFLNDAAERFYEEGTRHNSTGPLRLRARYMSRFYPAFTDLAEVENQSTLLAEKLYLPLLECLSGGATNE